MKTGTRWIVAGATAAVLVSVLSGCPLGRGSKKLGETCDSNTQCAAAHCQDSVCTIACKSDTDCAGAATPMACRGNDKTDTNREGLGTCRVATR